MRIVIDIDGIQQMAGTGTEPAGPDRLAAGAEGAATDAGAGPAGGEGGEAAEAASGVDSGGPPDWLLEAVAAAEAGGGRSGNASPVEIDESGEGIRDAGAAPGA